MYDVFSIKDFSFPESFLWGSATAGHQIEGDNIYSQRWNDEINGKAGTPSGKACNHYNLYKEDISLLKELKHQAFRLSVEWSRIEPYEEKYDEQAIDHYKEVLSLLKEAGIKTFVTLHHFTHPLWFEKKGGFENKENLKIWERYLEKILPILSPLTDFWIIFNEFNISKNPIVFLYYHARAYKMIKTFSNAPVSSAHAMVLRFPLRFYDPFDRTMADYLDLCNNEFFFHAIRTGEIVYPHTDGDFCEELKDTADFWAINYYTRFMTDSRKKNLEGKRFEHKSLKMIPVDFYLEEMYPEGLIFSLERLSDKPVYITENGCACDDDRFRIVYITLHLAAMKHAIDKHVDLKGYLYWSLLDNYEWGSFIPRFGLVHVDFESFKRTPKDSAFFYRDIILSNSFKQDILRRYLKELPVLK